MSANCGPFRIVGYVLYFVSHFIHRWREFYLVLLCALFSCNTVGAEREYEWDRTDYLLLATAITAVTIDWAQTRYIARHPQKYSELNPILGKHPSTGKVDRYFAASLLGTVGIAFALPTNYRKYWLGGVTFVEVGFVLHNKGIGIKADF